MCKSFSDASLTWTRVIACQMCFLAVITGSAGLFASRRTLRLRFWSSSLLNPHLRIRFIRRRRKDSLACRFVDSYLRILSHLSTCRDSSAANMRGCCLGGANEPRGNFLALDYFTRQQGSFYFLARAPLSYHPKDRSETIGLSSHRTCIVSNRPTAMHDNPQQGIPHSLS